MNSGFAWIFSRCIFSFIGRNSVLVLFPIENRIKKTSLPICECTEKDTLRSLIRILCVSERDFHMYRSLFASRALTCAHQQFRSVALASANTLKVKDEVKRKREAALLGGGQKRIDAQHKKGSAHELVFPLMRWTNVWTFLSSRKTDSSRTHRRLVGSSIIPRIRHVRTTSLLRLRHGEGEILRRFSDHWVGFDQRTSSLCILTRLHRLRWKFVQCSCC